MTDLGASGARSNGSRADAGDHRVGWSIATFMAGVVGRSLRIVLGLALIILGVATDSLFGWIVAAVGVVPVFAGVFNLCLIGPVLGVPVSGRSVLTHRRI